MKKNGLALLVLSFFLGMLLIIQFKTIEKTTGGIASSQKAHQLSIELNSLRDRKEMLSKELKSLESRIKEYKNSESEDSVVVKNLKNDIKKYELLAGYSNVKGPGVLMKLEEPQLDSNSKMLLYNFDLLLAIINKLNASGAEAISINNERIIAITEMSLSAEKLIINGNPIIPPFEIKCIGNPDTIEAALNMRYGIVWEIRNSYGLNVSLEKQENIKIPRYSKKINFKYSKPVE